MIKVIAIPGDSCANCYSLANSINQLKNKYLDVIFENIDANKQVDLISKYQIEYVPTVLVLKDDIEVARVRGYQPDEILEVWLDDKIERARGE